jgi:hypothetical protein
MKFFCKDSIASFAGGAFLAVVSAGILSAAFSLPASATVQFAKDTNMACAACHVSAKGGGPLTPYGVKFKANGNKVPS